MWHTITLRNGRKVMTCSSAGRGSSRGRGEAERQLEQPTEGRGRREPLQLLDGDVEAQVGQADEDPPQGGRRLEPGESGAQAVVDAVAERHVLRLAPAQVQRVGVGDERDRKSVV